ncbi:MAG: DUF5916 domain-containing protein [Candidatus Eisenbacteria bacterium]
MRSVHAALAAFLALCAAGTSLAQSPTPSPAAPATSTPQDSNPPVQAARLDGPVDIDGVLDEAAWQNAPVADAFHQRDPVEWAPASHRTEVRILFDDAAVYISARMLDSAPDSITARLTRRDVDIAADRFFVYIDPNRDRRSGYYFGVNAGGTLYDGTISNDGFQDNSWDGVWVGRARRSADGWTVEMRIPLSQMRFVGGATPEWGINFQRIIQRRNETMMMTHQPKNASGFVSRFVPLQGLRDMRAARALEILPYVTSKGEFIAHEPLDPFNDGSRMTGDVGADLRMSVGSRLTLNATINPDFGQVEVDPAVVNLSDAETYFSEKRPFFVEGSSNFRFGNEGSNSYWNFNWPEPQFFYSRRIGRGPQCNPPDSEFVSSPLGTTILGAAKLTGKLGRSWNVGTLHAVTNREEAKLAGSGLSTAPVEPLSYYGIARGLHEFKDRRFGLGVLGSSVIRKLDAPVLSTTLNSEAFVTGLDGWVFLDPRKKWVISGWTAMSHVRGSKEAISALQQNPRHYFQRPDAPQVQFDPDATSLTGVGSRMWLNKQEGDVYLNAGLGAINPGFDVNDMGYLRSTDVINSHFAIGKRWTKPTKWRKSQNLHTALFSSWNFDGQMTSAGGFVEGFTEFANNYSWNYETAYNPKTVNDRATRGGPQLVNVPGYEFSTYFDTDGKRPLFYYLGAYSYLQPEADAYNWNLNPGITIKPVSNVNVSVGPGYSRSKDTSQFVDIYDDALATATYGRRYLFANSDQTTLSANIRLNWAFSPSLSLQFFGQPYFTTASYTNYKELSRPRSYEFLEYGTQGSTYDPSTVRADPDGAGPAAPIDIGNRSFNYRSMRGNAVLRWEYVPGSTLFLVWTQLREDAEGTGDFALRRSARALFDAHPDNIFLAKLTYYFTP